MRRRSEAKRGWSAEHRLGVGDCAGFAPSRCAALRVVVGRGKIWFVWVAFMRGAGGVGDAVVQLVLRNQSLGLPLSHALSVVSARSTNFVRRKVVGVA